MFKLIRTKDKDKILRAAKENWHITYIYRNKDKNYSKTSHQKICMPRDNKMTSLNAERKQLTQNSILTKKLLSKMKNKDFFEGKKHGRRNHQ